MEWKPISKSKLCEDISSSYELMNLEQRKIWDTIKIQPEKWQQKPYGNKGKGFWVVAIFGSNVIWFNDIEDGYNRSTYVKYGFINEYGSEQDELQWAVQSVIESA